MNTLPKNVLEFTAGNNEREEGYSKFIEYYYAYKDGKKTVGDVSFAEADSKMLSFFKDEITCRTKKSPEDFMNLDAYCGNRDVNEAAFSIVGLLTDLIIPDSLMKTTSEIATVKTGSYGDVLKIDIQPRDLLAVSKGGRGKRSFDIKRQHKGTVTLVPEQRVLSVGIPLYQILKSEYTLAELVMKAVMSLETQVRYDIYDALAAAMAALPSTGATKLKVAGYSQSDVIALAQKVTAWNGGRKAIFLGTKLALSTILPASTNYRFNLEDGYVKVGHLRDFFGFDVVELEQIADYETEFSVKLSDTSIYVISPGADKIIKVFFEGSTMSNISGNFDRANLMVVGDLYKSWVVGAVSGALMGLVTVVLPT